MKLDSLTLNDVLPRYYDLKVPLGMGGVVKDLLDYILEPPRTVRFKSQPFGETCTLRVWLDNTEANLVKDILDLNPFLGEWTLELTELEGS